MDYVNLIGLEYPGIEVTAIGDPNIYENITWINESDIIAKEDLDIRKLVVLKRNRISMLSNECRESIISGFTSSAIGVEMLYDSEEVDQLNLIGATTDTSPDINEPNGYSILYACRDIVTNIKEYRLHTHFQLRQVMRDGAEFKLQQLQKFHILRMAVEMAGSIEEIDSVNWV